MTRRDVLVAQVRKRFPLIVATLTVAMGTIVLTATVFAATPPTQGSSVPNSALACSAAGADDAGDSCPYTSVTANTPFSSGQQINVVIPATENVAGTGPLFATTEALEVIECSAPNGVIPTSSSACDGNTINPGSLFANSDGSINFVNSTGGLFYPVYNTPDTSLGDTASSPACGNTLATECILYIGTQVTDFTQPHVWSQPFFVSATPGDSGADPGDGSPPAPATAPSASLSTVVAAPATATADGVDTSTVTVTLLGTGSVPVIGKTVSLTGTGHSTIAPATSGSNVTNSEGVATFDVVNTTTETVTYTATDTTDTPNVVLTQQATVDFEAPSVDPASSTVVASPASSGSTTVTVTLRDQASNPQPLAGQTVTLAGTGSTVSIVPSSTGSNVTNADGVATFTATDTAAETVTFTGTDTTPTPSVVLTETPSVTFGSAPVSPSPTMSTVVVNGSPAQLGGSGAEVVVTLLTSTGTPVSGRTVSLSSTGSTGDTAVIANASSGSNDTNTSGEATFSITDTAAETLTLTATDTTDSPAIVLDATPTVTFEAPTTTGTPSATKSSVGFEVGVGIPSSVQDSIVIVNINDASGDPLSGQTVELQVTGSATAEPIALGSTAPGITTSSGEAEFQVTDTKVEAWTATAIDTSVTPNVTVTQTASIGPEVDPGAKTSTVVASPSNPAADGKTPTTITVTITDSAGDPVSGQTISLKALPVGNSAVITTVNAVSNDDGNATFTATDSTPQTVTFQATDVTLGNIAFTAEAVVTFSPATSIGPAVSSSRSSVFLSRRTCSPNGRCGVLVFVDLRDKHGRPVSGKVVTLGFKPSTTLSDTPIAVGSSVAGTTGLAGFALFEVTDTTAEAVTVTATDATDEIVLADKPMIYFAKAKDVVWLPPKPSRTHRR